MVTTSAHALSLVGSTLGEHYLVLEPIGMGGMAVVYLVEHQTLHKRFAIKVLSPEHAASEEARARFTQEAHAASHLDHENIVTISDFGMTPDQRPFYVMELLRGQTLMDRIEQGPMTLEEVVAVSVPAARALAHAHAEGVIHRDVKPENMFLVQRSQGRWGVKVLDFGIAKVTTNPALTKMGQALGSPMFMSPEACRGDDVDQRSDLYSFGIVLYLMLTGHVPFSDESLLKVLQKQVTEPVPPLRDHVPDISPELEAVVLRALAKEPEDRYPTMDALLIDLQQVLPEGSDSLLIQAQFGALHDTPFPGQSLRMLAQRSSQRLMVGEVDASAHLRSGSTRLPVAPPKRSRRVLLGIGIVGMLAGGGGIGWRLWEDSRAAAVADTTAIATAPPAAAPIAPPTPAPAAAAPTPPPAVDPAPPTPPAEPAVVVPDPPPPAASRPAIVRSPARPIVRAPAQPPKRVTTSSQPTPAVVAPEPPPVVVVAPKPAVAEPVAPVTPPRPAPGSAAPGSAAPVVVAKPKPVDVGSLDAVPTITALDVNGPLPSSAVRRSIERLLPALRACYRTAATAQRQTAQVNVSVGFEIDESSAATGVTASGAFGSLSSCTRSALSRLQTQQAPDVGTVHVAVTITFKPV